MAKLREGGPELGFQVPSCGQVKGGSGGRRVRFPEAQSEVSRSPERSFQGLFCGQVKGGKREPRTSVVKLREKTTPGVSFPGAGLWPS